MNKNRVREYREAARQALIDEGIVNVNNGTAERTVRSYFSAFGAAVIMGSLPAAVAVFSKDADGSNGAGGSNVSRVAALRAMYRVAFGEGASATEILRFACDHNNFETREKFCDAAVALKLALNSFKLLPEKEGQQNAEAGEGA